MKVETVKNVEKMENYMQQRAQKEDKSFGHLRQQVVDASGRPM